MSAPPVAVSARPSDRLATTISTTSALMPRPRPSNLRHPVRSSATTPISADIEIGNTRKAASSTTDAMMATAIGALRVRGRSSVPSSTSRPASLFSAVVRPGEPCTSSTSPERSSRSGISPVSDSSSDGRYIARITTPNLSAKRVSRRLRLCSGDSSVITTSTMRWSWPRSGCCSGGRPSTLSAS